MTVPWKTCTRSLSPSTMRTWTATVSPGLIGGISAACRGATGASLVSFGASFLAIENLLSQFTAEELALGFGQNLVAQEFGPATGGCYQGLFPAPAADRGVV